MLQVEYFYYWMQNKPNNNSNNKQQQQQQQQNSKAIEHTHTHKNMGRSQDKLVTLLTAR